MQSAGPRGNGSSCWGKSQMWCVVWSARLCSSSLSRGDRVGCIWIGIPDVLPVISTELRAPLAFRYLLILGCCRGFCHQGLHYNHVRRGSASLLFLNPVRMSHPATVIHSFGGVFGQVGWIMPRCPHFLSWAPWLVFVWSQARVWDATCDCDITPGRRAWTGSNIFIHSFRGRGLMFLLGLRARLFCVSRMKQQYVIFF